MKVLSKTPRVIRWFEGRLSDGSDRKEVVKTEYEVVVNVDGITHTLRFDHDPTDEEIWMAVPKPRELRPQNSDVRLGKAVELAHAWNVLRIAAEAADADAEFPTDTRERLKAARDVAKVKLVGYADQQFGELMELTRAVLIDLNSGVGANPQELTTEAGEPQEPTDEQPSTPA